jgi:triphosphoribosyl-dephospho-CoA synthase
MQPGPGTLARLACILEASAPKAGNVSPGRPFADASHDDFVRSAEAIAPVLDRAAGRPVGETILDAVRATRAASGKNTNLGIVLLLAPLASVPGIVDAASIGRDEVRRRLRAVLAGLTRRDAELAYEAIRLASPGGLGSADEHDVAGEPGGTLLEMMAIASGRDLVALQYSNGYAEVFEEALPAIESALRAGRSTEEATVLCHLDLIARHGDSLIARKLGKEISEEASRRARSVLDSGWPAGAGSAAALDALDAWLRADGNRRNPGAAADLTAAALFLALSLGIIPLAR